MTEDGFREFVEVRYTELLRTAFLLTGRIEAAEDLVQSSLLNAMGRWSSIDEPMAYLRRAMVNQRTSIWRRFGSRELLVGSVPDRARPDEAGLRAERDELVAALRRLPPKMRAVLVLRYWEDLSEAETAEIIGVSVGTVKSQASRGLARLREALGAADMRDGGSMTVVRSAS
ncbi:RNA polymerase sigma-70 factor (sigma-E family) [Allocatelliglobosispora scoriae]|uniref:RNA polymerase sigma-70 factor (Sigma-E family) n=1 Tax=Allocatelliglobosispora scoriae TaxID=643052 RepID=A0A841BXR0_9ACTN|nr:SigE family RNA polymerase sigma factor [Allocatelliglobosispora scoriae]MBB5872445.1 RNA polymerase sigma-70 factor (sigma-E family) [Allocatelliglobosispora scoriae]